MDIRDLYAPFQRYLQRFSLLESLWVSYSYMQHLQFKHHFPENIEVHELLLEGERYEVQVTEWDIELLIREIIINAPNRAGSLSLTKWNDLATALDLLDDIKGGIDDRMGDLLKENILIEMYRIAHRQFPWQRRPRIDALTRYFKIFSHPDIDAIVSRVTALTTREFYVLGLSTIGHFLGRFAYDYPGTVAIPGVDLDKFKHFVRHFALPMSEMKKRMTEARSLDQDFAYSFNPLRQHPLIHVGLNGKHCLIAPIPPLLLRRFTEGLFYEICNDPQFGAAFGPSFEKYVGDVLKAAAPELEVLPEALYEIGKNHKATIDWIASDRTADLFLECKTRKVRYGAKMAIADTIMLEEDLGKMAEFVVQAYKTIIDAEHGHYPHWKTQQKPLYPMIVTLEDWYVFNPQIVGEVDRRAVAALKARGLDPEISDRLPYTILCVEELETAAQVMARRGIDTVMSKKIIGEHRWWNMDAFMRNEFGDDLRTTKRQLFPDDFDSIHPALAAARAKRR